MKMKVRQWLQKRKLTVATSLCLLEFFIISLLIGAIEKPHPIIAIHLFLIGIIALEFYLASKQTIS